MPFYLSEYIGSGTRVDPFRPRVRGDVWSSIDLRPDCGVPHGYALVNDERPGGILGVG